MKKIILAVMLAALGGCAVYPVGYYPQPALVVVYPQPYYYGPPVVYPQLFFHFGRRYHR